MGMEEKEGINALKLLRRLRKLRGQGIPAHSVPLLLESTHDELRAACVSFKTSYDKMLLSISSYKHGKTDWGYYSLSEAKGVMLEEFRVTGGKNEARVMLKFAGEWFLISNCRVKGELLGVGECYDISYIEKSGRKVVSCLETVGENKCLVVTTWQQ